MRHIGIFDNHTQVRTAIDNQELLNPYVAMVSGALDYNFIKPTPACYVEDSDGITYSANTVSYNDESITYSFDFDADVLATWTLYLGGNVVSATSGRIFWYNVCQEEEGESVSLQYYMQLDNTPVVDMEPAISIGYDDPTQRIELTLIYTPTVSGNDLYVLDGDVYIPLCGGGGDTSSSAS